MPHLEMLDLPFLRWQLVKPCVDAEDVCEGDQGRIWRPKLLKSMARASSKRLPWSSLHSHWADSNSLLTLRNYSSTQEDLDLRAKQVAWRINSGSLKSLYQKLIAKDGDEKGNAIEDEKWNLVMPTPEQILEEIF